VPKRDVIQRVKGGEPVGTGAQVGTAQRHPGEPTGAGLNPAPASVLTPQPLPLSVQSSAAHHPSSLNAEAQFSSRPRGKAPLSHPPSAGPQLSSPSSAETQLTPGVAFALATSTEVVPSVPPSHLDTPASAFAAAVFRIHFTASQSFVAKLEQVKDALAHRFPDASNLEAILEAGLDLLLAQAAKQRAETDKPRKSVHNSNTEGERIPAAVKRHVWRRDSGRCQWRLASGGICGATRFLQLDHIHPTARGGRSTPANIRLLCQSHNFQAAQQAFGSRWMGRFEKSG
jgi:hypothetical protein